MLYKILYIFVLLQLPINAFIMGKNLTEGGLSLKRSKRTVSSDPDDINFYTYPDSSDPFKPRKIILGDAASIIAAGLENGVKLTIIIHVHNTSYTVAPLNAYIKQGVRNVIWVDWEKLASPLPEIPSFLQVLAYPPTLANVDRTGKRTAKMISFLIQNNIITGPEMVHFVGWSTGAHVAAAASKYLKNEYSTNVLRITGLDPVGPLSKLLKEDRLSKNKASFVDVIHTSNLLLGTSATMGHADFFINTGLGVSQPGCPISLIYEDINNYFLCAHRLAITVYALTINQSTDIYGCPCIPFPGVKGEAVLCKPILGCINKVRMGEYTPYSTRGNYFVKVKTNPGPDT